MASTFTSTMDFEQNDDSSSSLALENLTFDSTSDSIEQKSFDGGEHNEQKIKTFLRIRSDVAMDSRYKINGNKFLIEKKPKKTDEYCFDKIFGIESSQFDVFKDCTLPLLKDLIVGKNSLVFTFGVTSSGKTFTMKGNLRQPGILPYSFVILFQTFIKSMDMGLPTYKPIYFSDRKRLTESDQQYEDEIRRYMVENSINDEDLKNFDKTENMICQNHHDHIESLQTLFKGKQEVNVWVSYFEIYNDYIIDLLNVRYKNEPEPKVMLVKDGKDQYYVNGLRQVFVKSASDAYMVYLFGQNNLKKHIAQTALNLSSSRSHSIFKLTLVRVNHSTEQSFTSSINFCDLAGAERIAKTGNVGQRAKETSKINQSLCLLKQCISALSEKKDQHRISFRSSKLTHVLQPYLFSNGGSFSTIINLNPSTQLFDESIFSLNFCNNIKLVPTSVMTPYKRRLTILPGHNLDDIDENDEFEDEYEDEENNNDEETCMEKNHCLCDELMKEKQILEKDLQSCHEEYGEILADLKDQMKTLKENHQEELKRNDKLWLLRMDCNNDKYQSELDSKISENEKLKSQLFEAETELVESQQKQEELQQKVQEFNDLEQKFITMMAEKENLRTNVICYEKEITKMISDSFDQFNCKLNDMKNINEKLKQYTQIIDQKLENFKKVNEYVKSLKQESNELHQKNNDLLSNMKAIEKEKNDQQKEIERLKNELKLQLVTEDNNDIFSVKKNKRTVINQQMSSVKKIKIAKDDLSPSSLISPDAMFHEFQSEQKCKETNNKYNTRSRSRRNLF